MGFSKEIEREWPEIESYEVAITEPLLQKRPHLVYNRYYAHQTENFANISLFKKVCVLEKLPRMLWNVVPLYLEDVTLYVFKRKLKGKIKFGYTNQGEEGATGKAQAWRWKACPTEAYDYVWEKIIGSADVWGNAKAVIKEQTQGIDFGNTENVIPKMTPGQTVKISASFSKSGFKDSAVAALRTIFKRDISIDSNTNAQLFYKWKGETRTFNKQIRVKAKLKVIGGLHLDFSVL